MKGRKKKEEVERIWKAVAEVKEERRKSQIKIEKDVEEQEKERVKDRERILRLETEGKIGKDELEKFKKCYTDIVRVNYLDTLYDCELCPVMAET